MPGYDNATDLFSLKNDFGNKLRWKWNRMGREGNMKWHNGESSGNRKESVALDRLFFFLLHLHVYFP